MLKPVLVATIATAGYASGVLCVELTAAVVSICALFCVIKN